MVVAVVGGVACLTLAANLFVVPAIADTLTLKQFAGDAVSIIDGHSVAYLGSLNYDFAFYSRKTIPIVTSADAGASEYLLVLGRYLSANVARRPPQSHDRLEKRADRS